MDKATLKPWTVYAAPLRKPPFDSPIVEIRDAKGRAVIPWTGFDATGLSPQKQKKLAQSICGAVNAYDKLKRDNETLLKTLKACSHALRSYQYGNSSEELAEEMADAADAAIKQAEEGKG